MMRAAYAPAPSRAAARYKASMRLVVALGGNALLRRGEEPDAETQRRNVAVAVSAIADLAREHEVVVTHGNGPQIGLLAWQGEGDPARRPYPLDVLGAETEGMIGYMLDQELTNVLRGRPVANLLTQVVVDPEDPAFDRPTKPIGLMYDRDRAERLAAERGWAVAPDGAGYRRVVPSPEPREIIELPTIRLLVQAGVVVICVGGGGIPVVSAEGRLHGVEAVIDKDLAATLLASGVEADGLLLLTDVPSVEAAWQTPQASPLDDVSTAQLRGMEFAPGSMRPKVEAACRFVEQSGGFAAIGALGDAVEVLRGTRGTRVHR
jgi:carbamate kinase